MKPKTLILMVVAVACGLIASYLTSRMLAGSGNNGGEEEKVKILVAKQKIPMGTLLKEPEKFFVEKEFTKGTEPKKAITTFEPLKERRVNKTLSAEVHVTQDDLMTKEEGGLANEIAPGYRAVAITVKNDTNVAGFVLPRSRVDVVSTTRGESGPLARIILQDVLVLAVDTQSIREGDKSSIQSSTVTLQLKPDEAEKLTLGASLGELRLFLRQMDDHEVVQSRGAKSSDMTRASGVSSSPDEAGTTGGSGATLKLPDVPASPVATPTQVAVKSEPEPVVHTHTLTIYNGETPTKAVFVLGDKNTETTTRIEKTPLEGLSPRKEKGTSEPRAEKETPEPKKNLQPGEIKPAGK